MRFSVALRPAALSLSLFLCRAGVATAQPAPPPAAAANPVGDRIAAIGEAGKLLGQADQYRKSGNKNLAEQLFSSAEIILGPDALSELAPLFREGAPPRIATPLKQMPKDTPAQPTVGQGSEEEEPPKPEPKRGSVSGSLQLGGKPLAGRGVVTLEPATGKWKPRTPRDRVMEQRNRDFAPKVLVVRKGSKVAFPNFDTVYHNVFSRSDTEAFDLGIYKNGQSRELTFEKPGIVRLGCNLHANMAGYIVVVDAPHYAITDDKGEFKFKSLAPGKYKMKAYTEKTAQPIVQDVTVTPDGNASILVAISGDAPANLDKFGKPRGK